MSKSSYQTRTKKVVIDGMTFTVMPIGTSQGIDVARRVFKYIGPALSRGLPMAKGVKSVEEFMELDLTLLTEAFTSLAASLDGGVVDLIKELCTTGVSLDSKEFDEKTYEHTFAGAIFQAAELAAFSAKVKIGPLGFSRSLAASDGDAKSPG